MNGAAPFKAVETADPVATPRRIALVRPDLRPAVRRRDEPYVMTFPHLIVREVILFQIVVIALSVAAMIVDAPLLGIANPVETPNPAKAPWYFLGLQELLHYFPPVIAGVLLPGLAITGLLVIPYFRVNLQAGPLWQNRGRRFGPALAAAVALIAAVFGAFQCWPVVVPTLLVAGGMLAALGGERGGRARRLLAETTLPEWIMTWFVLVAAILTIIGTFFRGPGWSFVWPWMPAPPA
jgi:hypothetical protein